MHAAKGLEFAHVYIIGMEEDILPHSNSVEPEQIQEERRIAYVAITRAKQKLTLTYTKRKQTYQESVRVEPSRFLDELPKELLQWEKGDGKTKTPETGKKHLDSIRALLDNI
jgi:ATP-dependent DNA helicase Rep